jgi:hypothetical protein
MVHASCGWKDEEEATDRGALAIRKAGSGTRSARMSIPQPPICSGQNEKNQADPVPGPAPLPGGPLIEVRHDDGPGVAAQSSRTFRSF